MSKQLGAVRFGRATWNRRAIACAVVAVLASGAAHAQTAPASAAPAARFSMAKQPLGTALNSVAQQTGTEIVFDPSSVKGLTAPELSGNFTLEEALDRLLEGTKLNFRRNARGVYVVSAGVRAERSPTDEPTQGLPEIIVTGKSSWSLNTGIARTEDDTQPYVVIDRAQIERSGATSIEDLFRDLLTVNNSASTAAQGSAGVRGQGLSNVNLRGLGANQTLVLIDGRRIVGANSTEDARSGFLGQTQINGIPIESVERIEVLASSASGIYGSNATGGVVNIILRRNYKGMNVTLSHGGTFNGGAGNRKLDLAGGTNLEGGKTNVSFFASISESDPLYLRQRDLVQRGRQFLLDTDPNYYTTGDGAGRNPLGSTPNIRSLDGSNLVLKNGTSLGSPITHLPDGYSPANGTAPLVANAGTFSLGIADTADGAGAAYLLGSKSRSGTVAVRREFASWLSVYGQVSGSTNETSSTYARTATEFTLLPSAANNPFNQSIVVKAPTNGGDGFGKSKMTSLEAVLGATVKLPYNWKAIVDVSANRGEYAGYNSGGYLDAASTVGILNGSIDILRDLRRYPNTYGYQDIADGSSTSKSSGRNLALRLAGPLPVELPGGKPVLTLLAETSHTSMQSITSFANLAFRTSAPFDVTDVAGLTLENVVARQSQVSSLLPRAQDSKSVYGEMRLPLISKKNDIPFVEALEVQIAGRQDRYDAQATVTRDFAGDPQNFFDTCLQSFQPLQPGDLNIACPPSGLVYETARSKRTTFNPSLSLRWQVQEDVALRSSYATGFVPPQLNQLARNAPVVVPQAILEILRAGGPGNYLFPVTDPLRGNEVLGSRGETFAFISGGNPDVKPETSKTWSAGIILTPQAVPDLRLSVDWTHITQKNNYFVPSSLLADAVSQGAFNAFMALHPERFTRGPASDGYAVGPITALDVTIANLLGSKVDAFDMAGSYQLVFPGRGTLDISAQATYLKRLLIQIAPTIDPVDYAGSVAGDFAVGTTPNGGARWKGNIGATWTAATWSLGARARYFGSYYLRSDHSVVKAQGSATVPRQIYFDLYATFKLPYEAELRLTANNVLNRRPPVDVGQYGGNYYSSLGDPRLGYYTVSLSKSF